MARPEGFDHRTASTPVRSLVRGARTALREKVVMVV
jgi:hypothetical protein